MNGAESLVRRLVVNGAAAIRKAPAVREASELVL